MKKLCLAVAMVAALAMPALAMNDMGQKMDMTGKSGMMMNGMGKTTMAKDGSMMMMSKDGNMMMVDKMGHWMMMDKMGKGHMMGKDGKMMAMKPADMKMMMEMKDMMMKDAKGTM
jgi:hypothetical protein